MNPKILIGVLFLITFTVSFVIYLLVMSFINIDLSSAAKKDLEIAPQLNESNFTKGKVDTRISDLQEKAMQNEETYQSDVSSVINEESKNSTLSDENNTNLTGKLDDEESSTTKNSEGDNLNQTNRQGTAGTSSDSSQSVNSNAMAKPLLDNKIEPFKPDSAQVKTATPNTEAPKSVNKVMVGSYGSMNEAKQAYSSMVNTNSNLAPIIKEVNGKYTLQVGAFSDKGKAETLVKTLNGQNYSATIKSE